MLKIKFKKYVLVFMNSSHENEKNVHAQKLVYKRVCVFACCKNSNLPFSCGLCLCLCVCVDGLHVVFLLPDRNHLISILKNKFF